MQPPREKNQAVRLKREILAHNKDMIKPQKTINEIKRMIKDCYLGRVAVQVNLGRNKSMQFRGTLSGMYPALFSVTPEADDFNGKTTYSYADVLCGTVKLKKIS